MGQRVRLGLLVFLLAAVNTAFPASDDQSIGADRFSPDAAAFYMAASAVSPPSGEDAVIIREEQSRVFEADGRSTRTYYMVFKVLTQNGANGWADISLNWEPWHEEHPTIKARVITPDHVEHGLDPKTIADAAAHEDDTKIYSNRHVLRAPLPAMTPGAVVEEEFTIKETAPIFGAGIVSEFYFGRRAPVNHVRLVLDAPAPLPLQYRLQLMPDMKPERTEVDGRVRLVFDAGPLAAVTDAPSYLPSDSPAYPHVTYSTGASWQAIAEQYGKIVDERIATSDVLPQVSKLVAGKATREDKIAAIMQELNRQVRYTGIEFDEAAIVPYSPSETLSRKYGDCKDKSALLVSFLRAAGIPAYIALLDSGFGHDLAPDLPGMGSFDHAIVYVPGSPEFWIDATDEYARLGQLPPADQGRLALVARKGESVLRSTPVSASTENLLVENREFYLSESGPARVVETSEPHGSLESSYRQSYADKDNKGSKDQLTNYMKSQYLAESLDRFERSDPADISKQFQLVLEAKKSRRGFTDLDSAVVAIRLEGIFGRIPKELQRKEKSEEADTGTDTDDDGSAPQPQKKRTEDYQLRQAVATEWNYKIVPPAGFRAKPLPKPQHLALGPATLSEEFSADKEGVVHAILRFDTVKRRLSVSEATAMRNKIAELVEGQPVLIYFEPTAKALFSEGKIRESFQAYRDLIALHPREAVHHLQLANALLQAGMGQAARDEARLGAELEPSSPFVQKTLAEVLEYDLVGRKFRPGSDYAGSEAAFNAARKLDPKDHEVVGNLAILLEYNKQGERYGVGAKLKEATDTYFSLTPEDLAGIGLKMNPTYTLFYSGQFAEVLKYAETLNPRPTAVTVAATAALSGSEAALEEARKRTSDDADLKEVLKTAGEILMRQRIYGPSADLFQAGASGDNASKTVALASMLSKAKRREEMKFDNTPKGVVESVFLFLTDTAPTLDKLKKLSSRNARKVLDHTDADEIEQSLNVGRQMRSMFSRTGLPADVMVDLIVPMLDPLVEGTDSSGYRVTLHLPGSKDMVMFVVLEEGQYKVLDSSEKPNAIGLEILDRVEARDLVASRQMLDWIRDLEHLAGGDDPFEGESFPRLWTKGKDADARQMRIAAASILVETAPTAREGIAILEGARNAASDADKLNIDLALMQGYLVVSDYEKARLITSRLASENPESKRLFMAHALALRGSNRWSELDAFSEDRLKRKPQDLDGMRVLVGSAEGRGDFKLAHSLGRKIVDSGKAQEQDLNNLAWDSLFTGSVDDQDVETAVKAAQMSQDRPGVLHTLGCVYAEVGKTQQARELLLQAMDALNLDDPDSNYWYAFGRIAEQYGQKDIAISLYSRATKPKESIQVPSSSYSLAQMRLRMLGGAAPAGQAKQ